MKLCRLVMFLFVTLTLLAACHTTPTRVKEALSRAEMLMDESPDTSLVLLDSINPADLHGDADNALYALLLTHGRYRLYIPQKNDSLIAIALDYYQKNGDDYHRMKSLFLSGDIAEQSGDFATAIIRYMECVDVAEAAGNSFWAGMGWRGLGTVYAEMWNVDVALDAFEHSTSHFRNAGNPLFLRWAMYLEADASEDAYHHNDAFIKASRTYRVAQEAGDSMLMAACAGLAGVSLYNSDNSLPEALHWLEILDGMGEKYMYNKALSALGDCYLKTGQEDKARLCLTRLVERGSRDDILKCQLLRHDKRYVEYSNELIKIYLTAHERVLNKCKSDVVSKVAIAMVGQKKESKMHMAGFSKKVKLLYGLAALIVVVTFFVIWRVRRGFLGRLKRSEHEVEILRNEISELTEQRKNIESSLLEKSHMASEAFGLVDEVCRRNLTEGVLMNDSQRQEAYAQVAEKFVGLNSNEELVDALEKDINMNHKNIIARLREEIPGLKESDVRLFCFIAYGLSAKVISMMLGVGTDVIYNRKASLKKKIIKARSSSESEFLETIN